MSVEQNLEARRRELPPRYAGARAVRRCEWCDGKLARAAASWARFCSQSCRQARQRFRVACAPPVIVPELPMRFAYADPPYIDCARRYYHCDEVDHVKLIERLADGWPDGWALSLSSESLPQIIRMIPASLDPRVGVWHKGSRAGVCYGERDAYEPLIVVGGRRRRLEVGDQLDNVLTWAATGRPHSHPDALIGMKSPAFCEWMFRRLGAARHDVLDDLFPGSGAVARAWSDWTRDPSRVDARTRRPSRFEAAQIGDRRR